MRKAWVGAVVAAALLIGVAVGAGAESIRKSIEVEYPGIKVTVNGKVVDAGASQPFIVLAEGRTYVPARGLAEAMGGKVSWDDATKTVKVATPRYLEIIPAGDVTIYSLPYYGASIKLPATFKPQADKANFINAGVGTTGAIVNRIDMPAGVPFDAVVNMLLGSFKGAGMEITASKPMTAPPGATAAQELEGTMAAGTIAMPMHARIIADTTGIWFLMATYDNRVDAGGAKAMGILDTFSLGK